MKIYKIRPGHTFRLEDGSIRIGGQLIRLGTDVAAMHPGAVYLEPDQDKAALLLEAEADAAAAAAAAQAPAPAVSQVTTPTATTSVAK